MPSASDALNKAVDAGISGVERLAEAVEKVAPDAWNILVRQQLVEGWIGLGHTVLIVGLIAVLIRALARMHNSVKDWDHADGADTIRIATFVVLCIVLFGTVIIGVCNLWYIQEYVGQILNPKYYAAREILDAVQAVKE